MCRIASLAWFRHWDSGSFYLRFLTTVDVVDDAAVGKLAGWLGVLVSWSDAAVGAHDAVGAEVGSGSDWDSCVDEDSDVNSGADDVEGWIDTIDVEGCNIDEIWGRLCGNLIKRN